MRHSLVHALDKNFHKHCESAHSLFFGLKELQPKCFGAIKVYLHTEIQHCAVFKIQTYKSLVHNKEALHETIITITLIDAVKYYEQQKSSHLLVGGNNLFTATTSCTVSVWLSFCT